MCRAATKYRFVVTGPTACGVLEALVSSNLIDLSLELTLLLMKCLQEPLMELSFGCGGLQVECHQAIQQDDEPAVNCFTNVGLRWQERGYVRSKDVLDRYNLSFISESAVRVSKISK